MAEKRMFCKTVIDSDTFLDMPVTARLLYYDLGMRADDDGFVNSPKKIMRMVGASQDDLSMLAIKKFIIPFETGVIAISHWHLNNKIRKDMHHDTTCKQELSRLKFDSNQVYTIAEPTLLQDCTEPVTDLIQVCNEPVSNLSTQISLGNNKLGNDRQDKDMLVECTGTSAAPYMYLPDISNQKDKKIKKPTLEEVKLFCADNNYDIDAEYLYDYYQSIGWQSGNNPIKDWHATVRNWVRREKQNLKPSNAKCNPFPQLYKVADENDRKRNG